MATSTQPEASGMKFRGHTSNRGKSTTPQNISTDHRLSERQSQQKAIRKSLTLFKHPIRVLSLFLSVSTEYLHSLCRQMLSSPLIMIISIPILLIIASHFLFGDMESLEWVEWLYLRIEWSIWWLVLGILSSIGLGTGMHSGLLFLFPFIGRVVMAAATCHSLHFSTFGQRQFVCNEQLDAEHSTVTFWGLFFKVYTPCFLWAAGTAIGEIPPYAFSLAAVRAGKQDEFSEIQQELSEQQKSGRSLSLFDRMKLWMIHFLERYGFWAVLAFAAWPNMAFDMAGIACGHFEMPFWTFFGAVFVGKALIKINLQSMFFITMFNEQSMNQLIDYLEHLGFASLSAAATDFFETQRNVILGKEERPDHGTPILKVLWSVIVTAFIAMFIGSTIQIFAQQKQRDIDDAENEKWLKAQRTN